MTLWIRKENFGFHTVDNTVNMQWMASKAQLRMRHIKQGFVVYPPLNIPTYALRFIQWLFSLCKVSYSYVQYCMSTQPRVQRLFFWDYTNLVSGSKSCVSKSCPWYLWFEKVTLKKKLSRNLNHNLEKNEQWVPKKKLIWGHKKH